MSLTQEQLGVKEIAVNGRQLVAATIDTAIRGLSTLPRKIDKIEQKVTDLYKKEFEQVGGETGNFYLKFFDSLSGLMDWLNEHLMQIPEIRELNLSQREYEAGIGMDYESRVRFALTSAFSPDPDPLDEFIDLDAYVRNVAHLLVEQAIEINFSTFK